MMAAVLNHLWQSTVFAAVIALVTLLFRKNAASVRYWLWWSASLKFLIPFALLMSLGSHFEWTPREEPVARTLPGPAVVERVAQAAPIVLESVALVSQPFPEPAPLNPPSPDRADWAPIAALAVWVCGLAAIGWMRLRGWLRIRAALDSSTPIDIGAPIPVLSSPGLLEPGIVGWFRPALLLPAGIEKRLTPAQLAVVIAHEMSHIRRRDNFTASLHMVVEALFWFHPLVWRIGSRLVAERERACDEAVLGLGREPLEYAEAILAVCKYYVESPLVCVSGIKGSDVKRRIEAIITNPVVSQMGRAKKAALAMVATFAVATPILVGVMTAGSSRAQAPEPALAQAPAAAPAQATESGEIATVEGKVLDSASGQPVEGAQVGLLRMDRGSTRLSPMWDEAAEDDPSAQRQKTLTGSNGIFRFRIQAPAPFELFIERDGYISGQAGNFRRLQIEPGQLMDDIVIQLQPEGYIRGRVVDIDTRQPLAGLRVVAHGYHEVMGERGPFLPMGASDPSDEDGSYSVGDLPPGDYHLEVVQPYQTEISEPTPVDDFVRAEQYAYASYWYPGAETVEQSIPVSLLGGGSIEDIEIPVARRRVASIRGRVLGEESEGEVRLTLNHMHITATSRGAGPIVSGIWTMNSEFQIDGLLPGTYQLTATTNTDDVSALPPQMSQPPQPRLSSPSPAETRQGSLRFELGDQNIDGLDFVLLSNVAVKGEVRIQGQETRPGQPVLPSDDMSIYLRSPSGGVPGPPVSPAQVSAEDGSLAIGSVFPSDYLVTLRDASRNYGIAEVRYNGTVARNGLVSINPAANEHRLEIVLAPATGSLALTVTDGIRPVPGALVRLLPGDLNERTDLELLMYLVASGGTDESGHATIGPLLPGVYRVTAFPAGSEWNDDPNLAHQLVNGEEVTVAETGTTLLQIRVEE